MGGVVYLAITVFLLPLLIGAPLKVLLELQGKPTPRIDALIGAYGRFAKRLGRTVDRTLSTVEKIGDALVVLVLIVFVVAGVVLAIEQLF
jgi:hypothetical protein